MIFRSKKMTSILIFMAFAMMLFFFTNAGSLRPTIPETSSKRSAFYGESKSREPSSTSQQPQIEELKAGESRK